MAAFKLNEISFSKNEFFEAFLYFLFLLPLSGTGIPAYIFAILYVVFFVNPIKFKVQDVFFLGILITWFCFKSVQSDFYSTLVLLRYYFGFYIFYIFFNNLNIHIKFDRLLLIICVVVVLEAFLINTIIKPEWLPNYATGDLGELNFETKILGFYQRPYSIGSNSTITSTLVMVLLFYVFAFSKNLYNRSKKLLYFAIFTVLIIGSGTGYMLLLLFFLYKIKPFKNAFNSAIAISFIILILYLIFVFDVGSIDGLDRISAVYLDLLYQFKLFQYEKVMLDLRTNSLQLMIGKQFSTSSELIIWSDFAWNDLFYCTGYVGFYITIIILLFKTNRFNVIPVLVFVLGAIHYGACYSLPGQLLLGYFLSERFRNFALQNKNQNLLENNSM